MTPSLRVSPTEPAVIKDLLQVTADAAGGTLRVDWSPEDRGLDYMWIDAHGYWRGVQRKEVKDFLASLDDGRLSRELNQMTAEVVMPIVAVEGRIQWAGDEMIVDRWSGRGVTRGGWNKRLLSIANRGVQVMFTGGMGETAALVADYWAWSQKATHSTGTSRPGPAMDWGRLSNRDWQAHLLQGLDGVGPKLADAILDTLGYCPLQVVAREDELLQVPGIGKKMAARILRVNGPVAREV